ncbi:MAG: Rieske 2Fe-2S domain-containing protein [Bacteroidetes bacterium]|nr:Rieske 2Fe-2S domain-containing protein [Bacteroidota bacterium]
MKLSRRKFFVKTLQGTALLAVTPALSTFLESCNTVTNPNSPQANLPRLSGTEANGTLTVNIDPNSALTKSGNAAIIGYSKGTLLVDHPSDTTYNVLSSICTHQQCSIDSFDSSSGEFICYCHGSRFDVNGAVRQGPAISPLAKYSSQFANNQLIIRI